MQYDAIILELMSRIKTLEEEVSHLKSTVSALESCNSAPADEVSSLLSGKNSSHSEKQSSVSYTKTTDQMIDACYKKGIEAYNRPDANIWSLADSVSETTGMNRSSAFMYICAVKSMLSGTVFKRAINTRALRRYFQSIYDDYGTEGLRNAISSVRKNISYRESFHLPSDSISGVCDEYEAKLS